MYYTIWYKTKWLKPTLSINPVTGQPSISLDASIRLQPDSIESIMDMAGTISSIDQPVLDQIFEIAEDIPGDIQQLCGAIWETTSYKDKIDESILPKALQLIYAREFKGYEAILVQLTGNQLKCLVGLAKLGGKAPLSSEFIREVGIELPASIKKALTRLIQLKIIYCYQSEYKFVNPFFKSWLLFKNF